MKVDHEVENCKLGSDYILSGRCEHKTEAAEADVIDKCLDDSISQNQLVNPVQTVFMALC